VSGSQAGNGWDPACGELLALLPKLGRGPKREGIFALWLTLRVAQDLQLDPPLPERGTRRRLAALETRLSSLTLPAPLRRALATALLQLKDGSPASVPLALAALVAPAREVLGGEAGDALQRAARTARQLATPSR
jgi:hypothetical protein